MLGLAAALAVVAALLASAPPHIQVIGSLAPKDRAQILRLVRRDLRSHVLPRFEWDSLRYPRYVINGVREYHAQKILWAEVCGDGHVEVFAGVSRAAVPEMGHHWQLRKNPTWWITGYSFWAFSNAAPRGMQVPP